MVESGITFGYWFIRGKGQVARTLFEYCGGSFNDKRYSDFDEWFKKDKQNLGLEFPNLPYLIDGDFKITESAAIERYIIGKYNKTEELIGKDALECSTQTMLVSFIDDIHNDLIKIVFNKDQFNDLKQETWDKTFSVKLEKLAKFLGSNKFLSGSSVKYADFFGYEYIVRLKEIYPEFTQKFPTLVQWLETFENVPKVKEYFSSDRFVRVPYYPPNMAGWSGL